MTYEDAWAEVWENLSKSGKQKFLDLPYFNAEIFKKITGIEVEKENSKSRYEAKVVRRHSLKKKIIEVKGGVCSNCNLEDN